MIKISVKEKEKYYDVRLKGKDYDIMQYIALLDILINNIKKSYKITLKEIFKLLCNYKKENRVEEVK